MAKTKDLCSLGNDNSYVDNKKNDSLTAYVKMDELHAFKEKRSQTREKLKIYVDTLDEYFPIGYTPNQKVELIEKLVKEWHERKM